jgi:dienelactone hydrolase
VLKQWAAVSGPWQVSFDPKWGGPAEPVEFAELTDWSTHDDPRIRYYSGTATYRKSFMLSETDLARSGGPLLLDLGAVEVMAQVRLNGHDCGVAWKPPYRVEIGGAARAGENQLEVAAVNLWINRMIGDEQLPLDGAWKDSETLLEWPEWFLNGQSRESGRYTFTSCRHYQADSPLVASGLLGPVTIQAVVSDAPDKALPLPGEVFSLAGCAAFIIPGKIDAGQREKPWVWYAPTLPSLPGEAERWMFERFRDAGIAVAGIDVGESYGSPAGRRLYTALYEELTARRGYSSKPVLLGRSRGGLMTLSWAADNPELVAAFAGIYPVCNLASYPGVAKAASAYELTPDELQSRLTEHNPVDRLAGLAKARVPLLAIHGDVDKVVPLEANSGAVKERYAALGGTMTLIVPPGQGHNMWPGFFESEELVRFVISHAARPDH